VLNVHQQRQQNTLHQFYKALIAHCTRKLAPQMRQDVLAGVALEIAVMRLMKADHNRHDSARTQLAWAVPSPRALCHQGPLPMRLKRLAEIIDMAEKFQ